MSAGFNSILVWMKEKAPVDGVEYDVRLALMVMHLIYQFHNVSWAC